MIATEGDKIDAAIKEHKKLAKGAQVDAITGEAKDTEGNNLTQLPTWFVGHVVAYAKHFKKPGSSAPVPTG